jgi:hypothetical protein
MAPLGRRAAIDQIRGGRLPFAFGSPHPCVAVVEQEGVFRIRALVVDEAESAAAAADAHANGRPWMPELHYGLGKPVGKIYAQAASRDELADTARTMDWPEHW